RDLFGFLTTVQSAKDLVLGQKTGTIDAQIDDVWRASLMDHDPDRSPLETCGPMVGVIGGRLALDRKYTSLQAMVAQLGSLRDERKNVVFVTDALPHPPADPKMLDRGGGALPKAGITQGRVGIGDHASGQANDSFCAGELQRLAQMDFDVRYRDLLKTARRENVAFYAITPGGLRAPLGGEARKPGGDAVAQEKAIVAANDSLITLAHETDGI